MFGFLKNISQAELIIIIIIILLIVFGSKIVKGLARTSGETVRDVKKIKGKLTEALDIDDIKSNKP